MPQCAFAWGSLLEAAAVFVIAVYARTAAEYGRARAERYVHLEAGHAAPVQAVSLDLGGVPWAPSMTRDFIERSACLAITTRSISFPSVIQG